MNHKLKIGCIGLGNMGNAICAGLLKTMKADQIIGYDIDNEKLLNIHKQLNIKIANSTKELSAQSDVIIIAVKPGIVEQVSKEIQESTKDKLILSIAAGITITKLKSWLGDTFRIIRCMPNTPAIINEGITVLCTHNANQNDMIVAKQIFTALGKVLILEEYLMDAVTALSGSGPAYVFTFIQALTDAGVKLGLSRNDALLLAAQTVLGSAMLVLQGQEPIVLRGKVTSPGGTTIDAIHVLERNGFSGIIMDAVEAAYQKSKKLGE